MLKARYLLAVYLYHFGEHGERTYPEFGEVIFIQCFIHYQLLQGFGVPGGAEHFVLFAFVVAVDAGG